MPNVVPNVPVVSATIGVGNSNGAGNAFGSVNGSNNGSGNVANNGGPTVAVTATSGTPGNSPAISPGQAKIVTLPAAAAPVLVVNSGTFDIQVTPVAVAVPVKGDGKAFNPSVALAMVNTATVSQAQISAALLSVDTVPSITSAKLVDGAIVLTSSATTTRNGTDKTPPGDPCSKSPGNPCNGNNGNEGTP
ncbi:MAG: hypothetical protein ABI667_06890, partial [Sphingomicrobium sp.]